MPKLLFKKIHPDAVPPTKAHEDDAAYDLTVIEATTIPVHGAIKVKTGLQMAIPKGYYGDIRPRSSWFSRNINISGIIDAGYRGEVMIMIQNHNDFCIPIEKGTRIAQLLLSPVNTMWLEETDELDETDRGTGGFGSTGE